jgi:putative transposase
MSQSLSRVLVHIVFSTRDRRPFLNDAVRGELHAYLATVASHAENVSVRVGGTTDHIHVALFLSRTDTVAKVIERLKVSSSKWIKTKGPEFAWFGWQKGYAAFSVGLGDCRALVKYIDEQAKHHQRRDFKAEMRAMFMQYGVEFEERYVWN